jgi:hypothetical protein
MRGGVVAGGVALMIIGLIFFSFVGVMWSSNASSSGGDVGVFFPQLIGGGLLFFGFILLIAGLAASSEGSRVQPIVMQSPAPLWSEAELRSIINPQVPQNAPSAVLAICPNCKMRIPSESKFCPECGYVLHAVPSMNQVPAPPKVDQPSQPSDIPRFCESCGAPREDGIFCKQCGSKLT